MIKQDLIFFPNAHPPFLATNCQLVSDLTEADFSHVNVLFSSVKNTSLGG